jgi:hypothetical protein
MEAIIEVKRIDLSPLKNKIKELASHQKFLKNQRKTVHFIGSRKIEPKEAEAQHRSNREELRIMYATYGILRGKEFSQIENGKTLDDVPIWKFKEKVTNLVNKYKENVKN